MRCQYRPPVLGSFSWGTGGFLVRSENRRREIRYNTEQMSRVTIVVTGDTMPGVITEVSRSGMRLTVGSLLSPGTILKIEMPGVSAEVEVKHCQPDGLNRYRAGVLTLNVDTAASPSVHLPLSVMASYALNRGLVPSETINVQAHLRACTACARDVATMHTTPYPSTERLGLRACMLPPVG